MKRIVEGTVSVLEILNYIDSDRFLTLRDTSKYLSLCDKTIRSRLSEIPHYRYGRQLLFRKSELDQWMQQWRADNDSDLLEKAFEIADSMIDSQADEYT